MKLSYGFYDFGFLRYRIKTFNLFSLFKDYNGRYSHNKEFLSDFHVFRYIHFICGDVSPFHLPHNLFQQLRYSFAGRTSGRTKIHYDIFIGFYFIFKIFRRFYFFNYFSSKSSFILFLKVLHQLF